MVRNGLLALHITAVSAWLGANLVLLVLGPRFAAGPAETAAAWTRQTAWLGERFYNVAGVTIGTTGVLLVLNGGWSWSSGFIWVGIAVLVIGGATGALLFVPLAKRRAAALEDTRQADADTAQRRILALSVLDTVLVLTAVLAMVAKWQI